MQIQEGSRREVKGMKPFFTYPRVLMPVEIEAKMKLDEVNTIASTLKERGAVLVGNYFEENTFYDTDDRALLAANEGLRLRVATNLSTGQSHAALTHKGPASCSELAKREETELPVAGAAEAHALLERLGYARCLSFEKRRQSWKFDGCKIEIDEVPHLGYYVEIEGHSEQHVMRTRESLGLSQKPLIKASYASMLTCYLQENGQTSAHVRFPSEETLPQTIAQAS
jgi:adenylate cyclase class 2